MGVFRAEHQGCIAFQIRISRVLRPVNILCLHECFVAALVSRTAPPAPVMTELQCQRLRVVLGRNPPRNRGGRRIVFRSALSEALYLVWRTVLHSIRYAVFFPVEISQGVAFPRFW